MAVNLRKEAKGRECQIRLQGCNRDASTTVLCHIHKPSICGGMSLKANDEIGAWGCSHCHDLVDGRINSAYGRYYLSWEERLIAFYEGIFRTQKILLDEGKL
jgi:hypothetical protein